MLRFILWKKPTRSGAKKSCPTSCPFGEADAPPERDLRAQRLDAGRKSESRRFRIAPYRVPGQKAMETVVHVDRGRSTITWKTLRVYAQFPQPRRLIS